MTKAKVTKYHLVDKFLITQGSTLAFDLYIQEEENILTLFLSKNRVISGDDKVRIMGVTELYVHQNDKTAYDTFFENHISNILKNSKLNFKERSGAIYEKATTILDNLFENPDALGGYEESKSVVQGMVGTIMDDEFTVNSLIEIISHDYYTHTHSINVSVYAISLGKYLGLKDSTLEALGHSVLLHDLGKSKVKKEIINKNGKLTDDEFAEMKHHPKWGYDLALKLGIIDENILSGIRSHHEKIDGSGYPDGLKDKEIPLFAKMIAVCDVFDALTTKRSYKEPMTSFNAFRLIKNQMPNHLDSKLLKAMVMMLHKEEQNAM